MAQSLLFLGATATNTSQLFQVNSATNGASVFNFIGYPADGAPVTDLTVFGGQLYFSGGSPGSSQLWTVSTLSGVATQVTSPSSVPNLQPANLTVLNGKLFFSGRDASGNIDLYSSDGTTAGSAPVVVAGAGAGGLVPDNIVSYGGRLYFSGFDATGVSRLWISDGTTAGTSVLPVFDIDSTNINFGGNGLNPQNITVANGKLLFSGTDTNGQTGLWVSDGTSVGTSEMTVSGAAPGGINPTFSNMTAFNGRIYFAGTDASGTIGLWSSDGTAGGTTELAIANTSAAGLAPVSLTVFDGFLYFGGVDSNGRTGLWKSDGTAAGTSELAVAGAGAGGLFPIALNASDHPNVAMSVLSGNLYFTGMNAAGTQSLWQSNGTAAGTVEVSTPDASTSGLLPSDLAVVNLGVVTLGDSQGEANAPIIPVASLGTVPYATYAPLVVGSGPRSITLNVAEEAFQGDAEYTISVDNVPIGGTLTASANYAAGQSQTVIVEGSWTDDVHTLVVDFINDGYGGSTETNRNLYVSLATPTDAVGAASLFLGYQGSQQIRVEPEATVTVSKDNSPPFIPPVSTPPVSTPPISTTGNPLSVTGGAGTSGGTGISPVAPVPVTQPINPVATTLGSSGGTVLLPAPGSASTVSGATGMGTLPGGTAVLAGMDTVSTVLAYPDYIVSQTAASTTYLTPKAAAILTTATSLSNVVYSQGVDTIDAQGASDLVFASGPSATVTGGSGTLIFVAGGGSYVAGGGTGTDILYGGTGTSVLTGTSGSGSILVSGNGNVTLSGGLGTGALMFGGAGTTTFLGSAGGSDTMVGGTGPNVFTLTDGDIAFGGPGGSDVFGGGLGNSLVVEGGGTTQVNLGRGNITAFAGTGTNTYSVTKGMGGLATIVGFKVGDRICLTGGFTAADATSSMKAASIGSFGTALSLSDGSRIILSGVTLQSSQIVAL